MKRKVRKPSKLDQIHRSQKALLRAVRGLTEEIGHLRRMILAIESEHRRREVTGTWAVDFAEGWEWDEETRAWIKGLQTGKSDPLNPVDSPQPPLV